MAENDKTDNASVFNKIASFQSPESAQEIDRSAGYGAVTAGMESQPGFVSGFAKGIVPGVGERPTPESPFPYRFGHIVGESVLGGVAVGKGASYVPKAADTASKGVRIVRNFINEIGEGYKRRGLLRYAGGEAVVGSGAGLAGLTYAERNPDSPVGMFISEFAGGMLTEVAKDAVVAGTRQAGRVAIRATGGILNLSPVFRTVKEKVTPAIKDRVDQVRRSIDPTYASQRAVERLDRQGVGGELSSGQIDANLSEELLPGAAEQMSFAQRSASPGLLALERDVLKAANQGDALAKEMTDRIQNLNNIVAQGFQFGNANSFRLFMENQQEYYESLMEARLQIVADETRRRLDGFRNVRSEEQANVIVSSQLNRGLETARKQEKQMFNALPLDFPLSTDRFARTYRDMIAQETGRTTAQDAPESAAPFLGTLRFGPRRGEPRIGQVVTIGEMRSMIGKLRAEQREATSAFGPKNFNRARIATKLADALAEDLQDAITASSTRPTNPEMPASLLDPNVTADLSAAVAHSKALNKTYRNPIIENLFAKNDAGERIIPETRVVSSLFGGAEGNRENFDFLMNAVEDSNVVREELKEYLRYTMFNSQGWNRAAAQRMLDENDRLLDRMPEFRDEIQGAIDLDDMSILRSDKIKETFDGPMNAATIFVGDTPANAINKIFNDVNPTRQLAMTMRLAAKDESGNAMQGLKQAFADNLFEQAADEAYDGVGGTRFLNYNKFAELNRKETVQNAMRQLFDPNEMRRFQRLSATARRLQMARESTGTLEGIQDDLASKLLLVASRLAGARIGGGVLSGVSLGSSLQSANIISATLRDMVQAGIENPSEQIIKLAVFDEGLFKALYNTAEEGTEGAVEATRTLTTAAKAYTMRVLAGRQGSRVAATSNLMQNEQNGQ